tara:strand:+ start:1831 stop:2133 length:303 start_codon:yes stop_codon:yes gene_type:complete
MSDLANALRLIALKAETISDASQAITQFISNSWTRGDRLLCGDCYDLRCVVSDYRTPEGRCDGCGCKAAHLWSWHFEDLPPLAMQYVENSQWVEKHTLDL